MSLDDRLVNAAVFGAAGKMGSGIALLLAHEMVLLKRKPEFAGAHFRLNLIDTSEAGLEGLLQYLKAQFIKKAEKSTILLRDIYADRDDLVENAEIIDAYVDDVMSILRLGTDLNMASKSSLIFEAIVENIDIKIDLY
ncbi:MAG: 3-hydroxyacyl-CoA dehydrogenase NAD-binding domain-containing protein, partial [candidate division KSB1 bacterium]|nr:3-hydroxyacyl-CoA dehydrogenase NAD-binding domain-containing protein [candidate division KSB1 bacterium]